jgi:hypothetical protein
MLLFCDATHSEPQEVVRGAYSVLGASIPIIGGCTGDEISYGITNQFYSRSGSVHVLTDSAVAVAIGSDAPMSVGIAHGWRMVEPPMIVTRTEGYSVLELDGEPALDVYLRRIGADPETNVHSPEFRDMAFIYPLGLSRRSGVDIRVIYGADPDKRSIAGAAEVPQGALVWVMDADYEALLTGAKQSVTEAVEGLGGAAPLGLLAFDCGGRKAKLGSEGTGAEVAAIRDALGGDVPFAGFYTTSEIARVRGALGLHQLTLVTLALA